MNLLLAAGSFQKSGSNSTAVVAVVTVIIALVAIGMLVTWLARR